jgi:hypothetical protein
MSVCRIRLILWLILAGTTVVCGVITYITLPVNPFPFWLHVVGVAGMLLAHFTLNSRYLSEW